MKKDGRKKDGHRLAAARSGAGEEPPSYGAVQPGGAADEAVALHTQGCNCCQAVLGAYAGQCGLTRSAALKLGSGFGGGIGRLGETCGAVVGGVLVLGLKHGSDSVGDDAAKQKTAELVRKFVARFKQRHGSIVCRQLLGCDPSKPEERAWAVKQGLFATRCPKLVRDAVETIEELA